MESNLLKDITEKELAIIITDQKGNIKCCNSSVKQITGYSPEELINKHIHTIKAENIDKDTVKEFLRAIRKLRAWRGVLTYKNKKRKYYQAETVIFPVINDKCQYDYCLIKTSKIERQAIMERIERLEILGNLAGELIHEINNILMAIKVQTELLLIKSKNKSPDILQNIYSILKSVERGSKITSKVLNLSKEKQVMERVDVNQVIESLHSNLLHLVGKNIDIHLGLANESYAIWADKTNIEQIILNLVLNARDAINGEGSILIKTEVVNYEDINCEDKSSIEKKGKCIKISIADSGVGIPEQYINKIFEPYFTTKNHGTGLGLSIVRNIVKKFGGFMKVKSEQGKGTTFEIYFPVIERETPVTKKEKEEIIRGRVVEKETRILIIEDEKEILEAISSFLEEVGFAVYKTSNLKEAEKTLEKQEEIDLIISDLFLPDGLSIEWMEKKEVKCPVIFCTGHIYKYDEMKSKGYSVLRKPYSLAELLNEVNKQLAQFHQAGNLRSSRRLY